METTMDKRTEQGMWYATFNCAVLRLTGRWGVSLYTTYAAIKYVEKLFADGTDPITAAKRFADSGF